MAVMLLYSMLYTWSLWNGFHIFLATYWYSVPQLAITVWIDFCSLYTQLQMFKLTLFAHRQSWWGSFIWVKWKKEEKEMKYKSEEAFRKYCVCHLYGMSIKIAHLFYWCSFERCIFGNVLQPKILMDCNVKRCPNNGNSFPIATFCILFRSLLLHPFVCLLNSMAIISFIHQNAISFE